ncbi:hypothetical protein [Pinibacter aurantiacus]|uniref:Uncharacterized protein n=1 Tax=Pinibacter aurantiacus TaxID=2851599 RepID=A0A9E2S9G1_9BACT|nr:hypothetical protein [Pinibacter aurantiacus]MBV4358361.1 hypothetical protein [Pinibacter aurantiacus]
MTRIVFVLVFCFSFKFGYSQFSQDTAYRQIKKLQSEGVDTILSYWQGVPRYGWTERSKQLGEIVVEEYTFIFDKTKGKSYVLRSMTYTDSSGLMGRTATSKPKLIEANLLLQWAAGNAEDINIHPVCNHIVLQEIDSANTVYDYEYPSHCTGVNFHIYLGERQIGQAFSLEDFEYKYNEYSLANLNYSYNLKTPSYKLLQILQAITKSVENDLIY